MAKHEDCSCGRIRCSVVARILRLSAVIFIFLCECAFLIYTVAILENFYGEYFTYFVRVFHVASIGLFIVSNVLYDWFRWQILITLPYLIGSTSFLSVAMLTASFFKPQMLFQRLQEFPGPEGLGLVHLGDWFYHQLPFAEAAIIALIVYREASSALHHDLYISVREPIWRWIIIAVSSYSFALFLLFYSSLFDLNSSYFNLFGDGDPLPIWIFAISIVLTGFLVFLIFFLCGRHDSYVIRRETLFYDDDTPERIVLQTEKRSISNPLSF